MGKTAYPTSLDMAAYLAGTGFLPAVRVTAGANSVTQTLQSTSRIRVGDSLYFQGAGIFRLVTAVPSATTVTLTGLAFTTTTGENAYIVAAALDLATMVEAGITAYERAVGRKMLALVDTTRSFRAPAGRRAVIDLGGDLRAITSLTIAGEAKTLYDDFRPLPEDADEMSEPWTHLEFLRWWILPHAWGEGRTIAIVGRWGFASDLSGGMPEAAWTAMLVGGVLLRMPSLVAFRTRGVISFGEADVNQNYGAKPYAHLTEGWQTQWDQAVSLYKRRTVG